MDITAISAMNAINGISGINSLTGTMGVSSLTGSLSEKKDAARGNMFDAVLNTAIDNIKTTNSYLSDAENEEIRFALGEVDNTHDLTIALQKASTALQYTVTVRDKLLEAYKEIMQMQI